MNLGRPIALLAPLVVAACAGSSNVEADFLCKAQLGTPCTTMAEADGRSGGASATPLAERGTDTMAKSLSQEPLLAGKANTPTGMSDGGAPYAAGAYRLPEKLGTIWIAPYLDGDGLLHEATYVHFVIFEAEWGDRG